MSITTLASLFQTYPATSRMQLILLAMLHCPLEFQKVLIMMPRPPARISACVVMAIASGRG
eukprot:8891532-Pyramimonas_sp.AAC.1